MVDYPWQRKQWQSFTHSLHNNHLSHALLLVGSEDLGILYFAEQMVNYLICADQNRPCGKCTGCVLYAANTHPDIFRISSDSVSRQIKIDTIRQIIEFMNCYANQGGFRIIIIHPAEAMNYFAANALLKLLEEPGQDTLLLLIAEHPEQLLPTVRSRCQQLLFSIPRHEMSIEWLKNYSTDIKMIKNALKMTAGKPLAALRFLQNNERVKWNLLIQDLKKLLIGETSVTEVSIRWREMNVSSLLKKNIFLLSAMIKANLTKKDTYLPDDCQDRVFLQIFKNMSIIKLIEFYDWLIEQYRLILSMVYLNTRILMDSLLAKWRLLEL